MSLHSAQVWRHRHLIATPILAAVTAVGGPGLLRIAPGDTLWDIARAHHTTVSALQRANGLAGDRIYAGSALRLPGRPAPGRPAPGHRSSGRGAGVAAARPDARYRVRSGDSLFRIAHRFRVSAASLAARNRLPASRVVVLGSTLVIPGRAPVRGPGRRPAGAPAAARYSAATTVAAARSRAVLAGRARPSKASVRATIRRTAGRLGVDPSLALAVAYQESGFQQHVVSPADAIGAMQVLPSTGRWLGSDVVGRRLDLYQTGDNVLAGVSLLRLLRRHASPPNAVAAYYQGLGSVRRHGMYAETKVYVRSVLRLQSRFR